MLSLPVSQGQPHETRGEPSASSLPGTWGRELCQGILFPWRDFHRGEAGSNAELASRGPQSSQRNFQLQIILAGNKDLTRKGKN